MKKSLLYFDLSIEKRVSKLPDADFMRTQLFKKYFPKFLKRFCYRSRKSSVASKVKRAKIIQEFETSYNFLSSQDWRILLANKMKSIKVLSNFNNTSLQFSEKIKIFSQLQSIKISMLHFQYIDFDKDEKYFIQKACKLMKRLPKLKCLELSHLSLDSKNFLKKLNSFPMLLSSLERLDLSCDEIVALDPRLLEMILQNTNLAKYITNLNLGSLCSNSHFQSFESLSKICPKLLSLTVEFSCRNIESMYWMKTFSHECFEVNTNYLQTLKSFKNLKVLNLNIADTFTFLKDFALPPSVQYLKLNFEECLSKEILKRLDPNFPNLSDSEIPQFFEENETLLKFYQNFQQLDSLDTLELVENLDSDIEAHKYQNYLSQSLVKRIFSLKRLFLRFSTGFRGLTPTFDKMNEDVNLASFWKACIHFGEVLQSIEIGHEDMICSKADLSAFHDKFVNLSSFKVKGRFYEFLSMNHEIDPLFQQIRALAEKNVTIKFCTFVVGLFAPLFTLLWQLSRLNKHSKAKVELRITFFENKDGFVIPNNDMKTEKGCQKTKGISLKLLTNIG